LEKAVTQPTSTQPYKQGRTGIARVIAATGYSLAGLRQTWQHEAAFRQEAVLMLAMTPAAFWLGNSATDIAILLASCFVVLITELLNSAVEAVVDLASPEHHVLAGRAKDMGSAAVFVSLAQVVVVWGLFLWQRFC
jgi:diacylglycerol kinase (ATP)